MRRQLAGGPRLRFSTYQPPIKPWRWTNSLVRFLGRSCRPLSGMTVLSRPRQVLMPRNSRILPQPHSQPPPQPPPQSPPQPLQRSSNSPDPGLLPLLHSMNWPSQSPFVLAFWKPRKLFPHLQPWAESRLSRRSNPSSRNVLASISLCKGRNLIGDCYRPSSTVSSSRQPALFSASFFGN